MLLISRNGVAPVRFFNVTRNAVQHSQCVGAPNPARQPARDWRFPFKLFTRYNADRRPNIHIPIPIWKALQPGRSYPDHGVADERIRSAQTKTCPKDIGVSRKAALPKAIADYNGSFSLRL